jgi:5-carboxymethyl-2-hydroxymuconate isomerase
MPHCKIEISKNIFKEIHLNIIMQDASKAIYSLNCFNADDIKVRIMPVEFSYMGLTDQEHAFVAAEIMIFPNKTAEQLNTLSQNVQSVLEKHFQNSHHKLNITTRISYLNKSYKRFKNF